MKKVAKKFKQSLSILLAVAMVVTCVPQTTLSVLAAENDAIDPVVENETELEVSTEDIVAVTPESDTEEISEEGEEAPVAAAVEVDAGALVGNSFDSNQNLDVPNNRAGKDNVTLPEDAKGRYFAWALEEQALSELQDQLNEEVNKDRHTYDENNYYFCVTSPDETKYRIENVTAVDSAESTPQPVPVTKIALIDTATEEENIYYYISEADLTAAEGDITVSVEVADVYTVTFDDLTESGVTNFKYSVTSDPNETIYGYDEVFSDHKKGHELYITAGYTLRFKFDLIQESDTAAVFINDEDAEDAKSLDPKSDGADGEDGVYYEVVVDKDKTITIKTAEPEVEKRTFNVSLNVEGATVTLYNVDVENNLATVDKEWNNGDILENLEEGTAIYFRTTADKGKAVRSVNARAAGSSKGTGIPNNYNNNKQLKDENGKNITLRRYVVGTNVPEDAEDITVRVVTSDLYRDIPVNFIFPEGGEDSITITRVDEEGNPTGEPVPATLDENEDFYFTLTSTDPSVHVGSVDAGECEDYWFTIYEPDEEDEVQVWYGWLDGSTFWNDDENEIEKVINIYIHRASQFVEISYNSDEVYVYTMRIDEWGDEYEAAPWDDDPYYDEEDNEFHGYWANEGSEFTLNIEPYDNCSITKVTSQLKGGEVKEETLIDGKLTLSITGYTKVKIESTSEYGATLRYGNPYGEYIEPVPNKDGINVYNVLPESSYYTEISKGQSGGGIWEDEGFDLQRVDIYDGDVLSETTKATDVSRYGYATINIASEDAGKTLTAKFIVKEAGSDEEIEALTYQLSVAKQLKGIVVNGGETIEQTVDSVKSYPVAVAPGDAALDRVEVRFDSWDSPIDVDFDKEKKVLTITTKPVKDGMEREETIRFVEVVGDSERELGAVKVKPTAPTWKDAKLTVVEGNSNDVELELNVTNPTGLVKPNQGSLWYKVEVTPKTEKDWTSSYKNPFYKAVEYDKNDKPVASQTLSLRVNNYADTGNGEACEFNVKVTLAQLTGDFSEWYADYYGDSYFNDMVAYSIESGEVSASTKNPFFASKITLKKKTTTVYTGQSNVEIATVQFDNNATVTAVDIEDLNYSNLDEYEDYFPVEFYQKGGSIFMSVDNSYYEYYDDYDNLVCGWNKDLLGKHTIKVTAKAPYETNTISATIVVTVVQGIEKMDLVPASDQILYAGKNATLKTTLVYNDDLKDVAPKAKKVEYSLVKVGEDDDYDPYENSYVTVNNKGVVTVKKGYTISSKPADNKFRIKVTAKDYDRNETVAYTQPITITDTAKTLKAVYLARPEYRTVYDDEWDWEYEELSGFTVVARDGNKFKSEDLDGLRVIAVENTAKDSYNDGDTIAVKDVAYANNPEYLTYKSSNKALVIDQYGNITVTKANVKNVKITVTTNDGGKSSKDLTINIDYSTPDLALRVKMQSPYDASYEDNFHGLPGIGSDFDYETQTITYNEATDTVLELTVLQWSEREDWAGWEPLNECANYSIKIANAKVLKKETSIYGQVVTTIQPSKEEVKVTLQDKGQNKAAVVYTIKNTAFSAAATLKAANVKTTDKLVANMNYDQQITYTLDTSKLKATDPGVDALNKALKADELYVMVKTDAADRAKKAAAYRTLEEHNGVIGLFPVDKKGRFTLNIGNAVLAGSYKLQFTFGKNDTDDDHYNNVIPLTKALTVTLKATAPKKGSYKPVSTLKMSVKDATTAVLQGTGKNTYSYDRYFNLRNANINGKSNGFTDYFEWGCDDNWDQERIVSLYLKPGLSKEKLDWLTGNTTDAKNARIAYIDYEAYNQDGSILASGTTKITVNFTSATTDMSKVKTASAYAAPAVKIITGSTTARVDITAAKKPASIEYAYAESDQFELYPVVDDTYVTLEAKKDTDGKYIVPSLGTYSVDLYLIPENNYNVDGIDNLVYAWRWASDDQKAEAKKAYEEAIKTWGIKVTTKVTVVPKNTKKKITIASADLKQTFTTGGEFAGYYAPYQNYWIDVPYKNNVGGVNVASGTKDGNDLGIKNLNADKYPYIYFNANYGRDDDVNCISISVRKDEVPSDMYGKTISVKAEISFGTEEIWDEWGNRYYVVDNEFPTETFTFKLTLPKKSANDGLDFESVYNKIVTEKGKVTEPFEMSYWLSENVYCEEEGGNYIIPETYYDDNYDWDDCWEYDGNKWNDLYSMICGPVWGDADSDNPVLKAGIENWIKAIAPEDSDVEIVIKQNRWNERDGGKFIINQNDFEEPTSAKDGHLNIRVDIVDSAEIWVDWESDVPVYRPAKEENYLDEDGEYSEDLFNKAVNEGKTVKELMIPLTIPAIDRPVDVEAAIYAFIDEVNTKNAWNLRTNDTNYDDIARAVRSYIKLSGFKDLRLNVEELQEPNEEWGEDGYEGYRANGEYEWRPEISRPASYNEDDEYNGEGWIIGRIHVNNTRKGGDIYVPFIFIIPRLNKQVENLKGSLDNIIWGNLEDVKTNLDGVKNIIYDSRINNFTVIMDRTSTASVDDAYKKWKAEGYEEIKQRVIGELTDAFAKDWDKVEDVTVLANVTNPAFKIVGKEETKEASRAITKQSNETIEHFAGRLIDALDRRCADNLGKYGNKMVTNLIGTTGWVKITVNFTDDYKIKSAEQVYTLTVK